MKKRVLSFLMVICMMFSQVSVMAYAAGSEESIGTETRKTGLCEHHTAHDENCGYMEAVEGSKCTHEHSEACYQTLYCVHEHNEECGFGENCNHECTVESGCITVCEECQHVHDENCGYVETVSGSDCGYVCEICNAVTESEQTAVEKVQAMIDALPDAESVTEESRATVEAELDAIDEAKSELSDEERAGLDFSKYDAVIVALNGNDNPEIISDEPSADNHTGTKEWTVKNETQHEQKWNCCGTTVVPLDDHEWKDGVCDECGYICQHADITPKDHKCDMCGVKLSECADIDDDHYCDYCNDKITACVDNDSNHQCDICKKKLSEHSGGTATCTKKAICDYCKQEYGELDSSNHTGGTEVKDDKAATCTEAGYTGDTYCKGCGEKLSSGRTITKLGHTDKDKDHVCDRENCKATISTCSGGMATCSEKAVCEYCGKSYGELDSSNHTGGTEVRNDKAATCTEDGYTGDTHCKGCGEKLADGKSIAKTGHNYESKVTKEATTTSTGTKTYTCKNCGDSYTEEIAKLPSQSTSPKTGDETPLVATIVVTLLSAVALIVLGTYKKRGRYSAK